MSNIKTYCITAPDFDFSEVRLSVNHDLLTPEVANEINEFWNSDDWRLSKEGGDVVRTVIRLFGAIAISYLQGIGGADISATSEEDRQMWTESILTAQAEGWPTYQELGIQLVSANVMCVDYEVVELEETA